MRVLVDAELILSAFQENEHTKNAEVLLTNIMSSEQIKLYITKLCIDKIRLEDKRRIIPDEEGIARSLEEKFRNHLIPYNNCLIEEQVFKSIGNTRDFECAVETACAYAMNIGAVVTHKPQDFSAADLLAWTVNDLRTIILLNDFIWGVVLQSQELANVQENIGTQQDTTYLKGGRVANESLSEEIDGKCLVGVDNYEDKAKHDKEKNQVWGGMWRVWQEQIEVLKRLGTLLEEPSVIE